MARKKHQVSAPMINRLIAKTDNQREYIKAVNSHQLVICTGPAGSGKTAIAAAMATECLRKGTVEKIVITRPLIDCGLEKLGTLPGTALEKTMPYISPVYEELAKWSENSEMKRWKENNQIQVIPIAYMRGYNLDNTFIIVEEAQNCSGIQLHMLLTRIGKDSKMVVSGDLNQSDLRYDGADFSEVIAKLHGVEGIAYCRLTIDDVVRSDIVGRIIRALGI